jgi:hypothetical protein
MNPSKFDEWRETGYIPPEMTAPIKEAMHEDTKPNEQKTITRPFSAFRLSALSLSMLSSCVSAWFSFGAISSILPLPIAVILSVIVVASATVAPELIILLFRRQRFVTMFFVGFVGIVASSYSMVTTIAGQYDAREIQDVAEITGERNESERLRIIRELDRINVSIDTYQKRITRATDAGTTDTGATILKRQDEAKKAGYEQALVKINDSENDAGYVRTGFYDWIGTVTGINGDAVEFGASVLPALLLDVAAPVFAVCYLVL